MIHCGRKEPRAERKYFHDAPSTKTPKKHRKNGINKERNEEELKQKHYPFVPHGYSWNIERLLQPYGITVAQRSNNHRVRRQFAVVRLVNRLDLVRTNGVRYHSIFVSWLSLLLAAIGLDVYGPYRSHEPRAFRT